MSNLDLLTGKGIFAKDFYKDFMEPCVDPRVLVIGQTVVRVSDVSRSGVFKGFIVFDMDDYAFPDFYIPEFEEVISVTLRKSRVYEVKVGDIIVRGDSLWTVENIKKLDNGFHELSVESLDNKSALTITTDPVFSIEIVM